MRTTPVENAVGDLYTQFYKLRVTGQYQEEYDNMGALLKMLTEDRAFLRSKYKVKD